MTEYLFARISPEERAIVARFTREHPVKVGALAEALGLIVTRTPLAPKISGLIRPNPEAPAGFEIRVNKYESPERQRFTVAHEIGHYLLHRDDIGAGVVDSVLYRSSLTSRKETEANKMAAAIVMPEDRVSRELVALGGRREEGVAEELARIFRVSLPAMKVRIGMA